MLIFMQAARLLPCSLFLRSVLILFIAEKSLSQLTLETGIVRAMAEEGQVWVEEMELIIP